MAFKDKLKSELEIYKCNHCKNGGVAPLDGNWVCYKCGWIYGPVEKNKRKTNEQNNAGICKK